MRVVLNPHAAYLLPLAAAMSAGAAHAAAEAPLADNIIAVKVSGHDVLSRNTPFVDVTVCNTRGKCKTVSNVMVDTGSTGLRMVRGAVEELHLDPVTDAAGQPLANWGRASSSELWGPVHWAKVQIGKVTTQRAIPIQVFDAPTDGELVPAGYGRVDKRRLMGFRCNGVLGIGPQRHVDTGYYRWEEGSNSWLWKSPSQWVAQGVDRTRQLVNPIARFPAPYNNGSVLSMPAVDWNTGAERVRGLLGLGIGEPTDRLFESGRRVLSHDFNDKSQFPAVLGGRRVELTARTSTSGMTLDLAHLGIPRHASSPKLYDAKVPTVIDLTVPHAGEYVRLARPLYVGPTVDYVAAHPGHGVLPMIVGAPDRPGEPNVLGMPFYYGRTVATGLAGTVNPFAQGRAVNSKPVAAAPFSGPLGVHIIDDHVDRLMSIEDDEDIEIIDDEVQIVGGTKLIDDYVKPARAPAPAPVVEDDFVEYSVSPNGYIAYTDSSL